MPYERTDISAGEQTARGYRNLILDPWKTTREDFAFYMQSLHREERFVNTILLAFMAYIDAGFAFYDMNNAENYRIFRIILRMAALALVLWLVRIAIFPPSS
jgi:hypothetical protein